MLWAVLAEQHAQISAPDQPGRKRRYVRTTTKEKLRAYFLIYILSHDDSIYVRSRDGLYIFAFLALLLYLSKTTVVAFLHRIVVFEERFFFRKPKI